MKHTKWAKLLSVVLTIVMMCSMMTVAIPTTSAAIIETIEPGESWEGSWSASQVQNYLDMTVSETGLYTLTVTDYYQWGYTNIYIFDNTEGSFVGTIGERVGYEPYVSVPMMLIANHDYSLEIYYYDDDWNYCDAWMSVALDAATEKPTELPNVAVNSSKVMISLDTDHVQWVRFTAAETGDYTMNFSSYIGAYVEMYDAATGEWLDSRDTQYYLYGSWQNGTRASFNLKANTEYYFMINNYESNVSCKVSMTKNDKVVTCITIGDATSSMDCQDNEVSVREHFNYVVSYLDGSSKTYDYSDLCRLGLEMPYVELISDSVYANTEWFLVGGNRPVIANYRDEVISRSSIYVETMSDWLVGINATEIHEEDRCRLTNDGIAGDVGYYRLKMTKTGVYEFYANGGDWDLMDEIYFEILDSRNNLVQWNEGYSLVGGQEYVLSVYFTYNEYASTELRFWAKCEKTQLFPDASPNAWYSSAVAYSVGRGILSGFKNGKFGTTDGIQRQDFLVMLARLDGVYLDDYKGMSYFPDVAKNSYYEAAVNWGYENGIVTGYNSGYFGVGNQITREQLVTFIQRYAAYKGIDITASAQTQQKVSSTYSDFRKVSAFAKDSVVWAIEKGVIKGKTATTIVPQGNAQRCEVAQMMYNIFLNDVL